MTITPIELAKQQASQVRDLENQLAEARKRRDKTLKALRKTGVSVASIHQQTGIPRRTIYDALNN